MTARRSNGGFASRPRDADAWIKAPDRSAAGRYRPIEL